MSTDRRMDKEDVVYIYIYIRNGILVIKINEIMLFAATWMDVEMIILHKWSKSGKERQIPHDITYT